MKTLLMTIPLLLLALSCDNAQRNRVVNPSSSSSGLTDPGVVFGTGTTTGTSGGTTGSTTGSTLGAGFESCDLSTKYYAQSINYMGICQSTASEGSVIVKSTISDSNRTCLIPTYKDNSGGSTYLGQPQCYTPVADQTINGTLYKTRSGFTDLAINGVMVLKEASLTAYYTCMNAYVNFVDSRCPQGSKTPVYQQHYSPYAIISCDALAKAAMTNICTSFKTTHPYIDIRLKN